METEKIAKNLLEEKTCVNCEHGNFQTSCRYTITHMKFPEEKTCERWRWVEEIHGRKWKPKK